MIAALRFGTSFGAEWAGVCTALFVRPRMPWPQVRQGSDGVGKRVLDSWLVQGYLLGESTPTTALIQGGSR